MNIKLHSILSGGTVDGPGIRTVIFTQGCPLSCKYCHNRDTWNKEMGTDFSLLDVVGICVKNKQYYGKRGGVTISGGEPLLQGESVYDLCLLLKKEGLNVCLDTAGSVVDKWTEKILKTVDLVILDIKHSDECGYKNLAGGNIETTLEFLKTIRQVGTKFWIRQVIVSGCTNSKKQLDDLLLLLDYPKKAKAEQNYYPEKIELLGYHGNGKEKWEKQNVVYPYPSMPDFDVKKLDALNNYIQRKINE